MASFDDAIRNVKALTQQQIVATAKAKNAEVMRTDPRPLAMVRHVDGVKDAPEEQVKPDGVIVYDYNRLDQVASFALDTLRQLSPIDSGDYVRSHVIMLNGTPIGSPDSTRPDLRIQGLEFWKPGDRITISNTMPYTRKIEIGKKGYRAHAHVYDRAAVIVNRRFGNQATVYSTYEPAPRGGGANGIRAWAWNTNQTFSRASAVNARSKRNQEWLIRQPTLVILEL